MLERLMMVLFIFGALISMGLLMVLAVIVGIPNLFGVPKEVERAGQVVVLVLILIGAGLYVVFGGGR